MFYHSDDFRRKFDDRSRRKLEQTLRGLLVKVTHRAEVKRKFKISKLTPTPASLTNFMKGDVKTDVATYFYQTYNRRLMYPFMPCIVTGRDVFLPMEICYVIEVKIMMIANFEKKKNGTLQWQCWCIWTLAEPGYPTLYYFSDLQGQRHIKKLNEKQTADMIKYTCQPPTARANKIKDGLQILSYKDNEFIKGFGLKISNEMKELKGKSDMLLFVNEFEPSMWCSITCWCTLHVFFWCRKILTFLFLFFNKQLEFSILQSSLTTHHPSMPISPRAMANGTWGTERSLPARP